MKDSFKKFSLFFCQAEIVFVIVWFLDHFTLEYVPSMNRTWIITPANFLHVRVTKFKASLIFFKQSTLALNSVIWVDFFTILFDETQHFIKIYRTGYVPVFYEIINLLFFFLNGLSMVFIEPQNMLLMGLAFFFIYKLKGWNTICKILSFHSMQLITKLLPNMRKQHIKTMPSEVLFFWLLT